MSTGNELLTRLGNLVNEYDNSVADEQTRALDHFNAEKEKLEAEISALGEDYLLSSSTFPTVAARSPNRYLLPADFKEIRYLERVLDDSTGDYERIWPIQHIGDKEYWRSEYITGMLTTSGTNRPDGYLLGSDFIQLEPISDAVYTLRLWYVRRYADITAADDELEIPHAVIEALILGTAIRERLYRRDSITDLKELYREARNRGLSNLQVRRQDGPVLINYISAVDGEYV